MECLVHLKFAAFKCLQGLSLAVSTFPDPNVASATKSSVVFKMAIFLTLCFILLCRFCGYKAINLCPVLELDLE